MYQKGVIAPDAFSNNGPELIPDKGPGMSVSRADKISAEDFQNESNHKKLPPEAFGVLSLNVGDIHSIPDQEVFDYPTKRTPSHATVTGKKEDPEILSAYLRICDMVIPPEYI